ncbi:uncharacterized protein LOC105834728 isoform X2 [Monomorium pharaonis]|uniref:uncharacterized protein LOC105834728 isoform X2 n=1 Tax=Monomorium pharaonis TaxID=307658 RepID=UPI00102E0FEF|nr:uncharacterized protein LOC105834728 isoform X2 [Monomorium pharaonis]
MNHENCTSFSPMQRSTTTTSQHISTNIVSTKSGPNTENYLSVSSLQSPTSTFVTSRNFATPETTHRYDCLTTDTIERNPPFTSSTYVLPSLKPTFQQSTQRLEDNQNLAELEPIETSTPESHEDLSNNRINETDKQDESDNNEQSKDTNELNDEEDESTNHFVISNTEHLNPNADDRQLNLGDDFKRLFDLLENICTEMRTGFNRICLEMRSQKRTVIKPDILPKKTIQNVEEFNHCDDDQLYTDVVDFLTFGGFDLRNAFNLCMKESMTDELSLSYSW